MVSLNQKQLLFFKSEVREASLTGCILSNREMKSRAKDGNSNGNTPKNESAAREDQQIAQISAAAAYSLSAEQSLHCLSSHCPATSVNS